MERRRRERLERARQTQEAPKTPSAFDDIYPWPKEGLIETAV